MSANNRLLKVLLWRFISITVTMLVLFMATGNLGSATGITLLLHALLIICHYVFETYWEYHCSESRRSSETKKSV